MREWHQWANSPYDEQRGLSDLPQDRRGRKYRLSANNADEFPTPHPNYWPNWSKPSYLQYYMSNHSRVRLRPRQCRGGPNLKSPLALRERLHRNMHFLIPDSTPVQHRQQVNRQAQLSGTTLPILTLGQTMGMTSQ